MASQLLAVEFAAHDPAGLGAFWAQILGREAVDDSVGISLPAGDDAGLPIRFVASAEPRTGPNLGHFDLTSDTPAAQQQAVDRALGLGAGHLDVGQRPEEGHVVLADPEGNEFCVIEAGNRFLAGTSAVGALACDGSAEVGRFWSAALGWPLVWDQDEETAIQSPRGGTKISWGGPPVAQRPAEGRVRFDLGTTDDLAAEVDRLVGLGAARSRTDPDGAAILTDPDGTAFRLWAAV